MFFSNHFNHTISLVAVEPTMYSNSIVLLAMHGCFQLTHVTRPPFTKRKIQVCELQSSMLPFNSPNHNMLTRCEGDYQHWTLWQSLVTTQVFHDSWNNVARSLLGSIVVFCFDTHHIWKVGHDVKRGKKETLNNFFIWKIQNQVLILMNGIL